MVTVACAGAALAPAGAFAASGRSGSGRVTHRSVQPPAVGSGATLASRLATAHAAAQAAIATLPAGPGGVVVEWQRDGVLPAVVAGIRVPTLGSDALARARGFVDAHPTLVGCTSADLAPLAGSTSRERDVVRFQRRAFGLAVLDAVVSVTLDAQGNVVALVSDLSPIDQAPAAATISASLAQAAARAALGPLGAGASIAEPELALWSFAGTLRRVWVVQTVALPGVRHERVLVDAVVGQVVALTNQVKQ